MSYVQAKEQETIRRNWMLKSISSNKEISKTTKKDNQNICRPLIDLGDKLIIQKSGRYDETHRKLFLSNSDSTLYLTKKEIEIYYYCIFGHPASEIAKIMCRSKRTVESHLQNIKDKLNCKKQGELIALAITSGLVYSIFNAMDQINHAINSKSL